MAIKKPFPMWARSSVISRFQLLAALQCRLSVQTLAVEIGLNFHQSCIQSVDFLSVSSYSGRSPSTPPCQTWAECNSAVFASVVQVRVRHKVRLNKRMENEYNSVLSPHRDSANNVIVCVHMYRYVYMITAWSILYLLSTYLICSGQIK